LLAVDQHDGELDLTVETTADLVGCPSAPRLATAHGRRVVRMRNLPNAGRPVTLLWIKRLWRCDQPLCPRA
jgi:hypothetical protein